MVYLNLPITIQVYRIQIFTDIHSLALTGKEQRSYLLQQRWNKILPSVKLFFFAVSLPIVTHNSQIVNIPKPARYQYNKFTCIYYCSTQIFSSRDWCDQFIRKGLICVSFVCRSKTQTSPQASATKTTSSVFEVIQNRS